MKNRFGFHHTLVVSILLLSGTMLHAQIDSWTNSVSGKWEEASSWSLGIAPETNDPVVDITNAGVKTVTIDSNTAQNFPETLPVDFLTISAPADSFNTLVVTNAAFPSSLAIYLYINQGSNSAVELYSSFLQAEQMYLGGNFTANESQISIKSYGDDLHLGVEGPGVFNMTNSLLSCWDEYLGGAFPGTFNQQGGTNSTRSVYLQNSGVYNLFDGVFGTPTNAPTIYFQSDSEFNQFGGNISASLIWPSSGYSSGYHLAGGNFSCSNLDIPYNPYISQGSFSDAYFLQSGGTNLTDRIRLGTSDGPGYYTLSGGVLISTGLVLQAVTQLNPSAGPAGSGFLQSGGFHTNAFVSISGGWGEYYDIHPSIYTLSNGILETLSLELGAGEFDQFGGTNLATSVSLINVSTYLLNAGWLVTQNAEVNGEGGPAPFGGGGRLTTFQQSGGTNVVSGTLSLTWDSSYEMRGGKLVAQNVSVGDSAFHHFGGTVNIQGQLALTNGNWYEQADGGEMGQLQLLGGTNSISFTGNSCVPRFADSSGVLWSNAAMLVISNWSGSLYGGGNQQIIFGNKAAALTSQQLSQIQFQAPAGLPSGNYPARILATGEIVPDSGAMLSPKMSVVCLSTNSAMRLSLGGDIGRSYDIEVSTDMVNWTWWTNEVNTNGTIHLNDSGAANYPQRFYRARPVP